MQLNIKTKTNVLFRIKISVQSIIICTAGYFHANSSEGKGKYNGNSWYKKCIHVVNVFEIRGTNTSHLSLKSNKNIPVFLTKTLSTMKVFFYARVYLHFHFGILISHYCSCLCLTKNAFY